MDNIKLVIDKYSSRLLSIHTRNIELLSAVIFVIGSISILTSDAGPDRICDFFFSVHRCYPTFTSFVMVDVVPIVSSLVLMSIAIGFFVGALMGYNGHNIRAWVTLIMGTLWIMVSINLFKELPLHLPYAWTFLGIGIFLVRGFKEQWIRRDKHE